MIAVNRPDTRSGTSGGTLENCVVVNVYAGSSSYKWFDDQCQFPHLAVCERAVGLP